MDPQRLLDTLESLREGIQILAPDWRYLFVNEAVARHGRRSRDELLGRTMLECYPGIEHTEVFATLARCMRERVPDRVENEFVHENGERAWFELSIQPCSEGIIVLSLDCTERKRLEGTLRQTHKLHALGQMAAGVAHDLKNLLNPLALLVDLLGVKLAGDAEAQKLVRQMAGMLNHGRQVVSLLKDFGQQSPAADALPTDLNAVVREAIQICQVQSASREARVEIEEELANIPAVRVSASELLSAVVNLLVNATDALSTGGRIIVRTASSAAGTTLEVEDDGPGMPPDVEARAFEPFFTTKGERGTGLGLSTVFALVARHDGTATLRTAPGRGTTVTLRFPASGA